MKMKISVIIPVYNGEKYVAQCLENMICQTYKNLEIIVINDGSTDSSGKIAEKYAENFPMKIIHQENRGLPAARNAGINCVTGDYVHFMDVDDLINLEFYENMLETALDIGADMVCSGIVNEKSPKHSVRYDDRIVVSYVEDKFVLTKVRMHGSCCKYLFRTSFLKSNNLYFDEEFRIVEDWYYSFQAVYYANKVASVPQAVYYYKYRVNSQMTLKEKKFSRKRRFFKKKASQLCNEFAKQHGLTVVYPPQQRVEYKLFGIPVGKKITFCDGKERWYVFGIYVFQRRHKN